MLPLTGLNAIAFCNHLEPVFGPLVDDVSRKFTVILPQIPTSVAVLIIHTTHDGARSLGRRLDPTAHTEGLVYGKVSVIT